MFGVLIVVLRPNHIAGLDLSLGQREIPLIASLRVLRAPQFGAGDIRCPMLRAVNKWPRRFGAVRARHSFRAILHGSLLGNAGEICPVRQEESLSERNLRRPCSCPACTIRSGKLFLRKRSRLLELIGSVVVAVPADYTRYL
jgi:hypothetical protein